MSDENSSVTVDNANEVLSEILMNTLTRQQASSRIVEVTMSPHEDGVVYDGRIVIDDPEESLSRSKVEQIFHLLKHCFKGDYEKVPEWMVECFRSNSGKHSRVGITYTITSRDGGKGLVVNLYRSMAGGASGAHQLCKITAENSGHQKLGQTRYKGKDYYVLPLTTQEANRLMGLFCTMAVDALESSIFEQEVGKDDSATYGREVEKIKEEPAAPPIMFSAGLLAGPVMAMI